MHIELEDECALKADEICKAGCRLTAEVLQTGVCIFAIEEPEIGDYEIAICQNGPNVPIVIANMLREFDPKKFADWKRDYHDEIEA